MLTLPLNYSTSVSASSETKYQYIRAHEYSVNPRPTLSFSRSIIQGSVQITNVGKRAALTSKRFIRAMVNETKAKSDVTVKEKSVSVVLLAGGKGKRMGVNMPKQYLPLIGQPIALYSFFTFCKMKEVKEIVVVCDPSYKDVFEDASDGISVELKFGKPGKERQDSVFNGLQEIDGCSELVCIHDSARPLVSASDIEKVFKDAWLYGAAVLGVPAKATIKEVLVSTI